jgi:two-component system sensor histidine kinase ChiS
MNPANILIVDDTPANLRLLAGMLTEHNHKVRPVPNGMLALRAVQAAPPDLILLDINMPGMDGYEVCTKLKADDRTKDIPVIFISALNETLDKVKAFQVGGVDYVTKPFQFEEVLARVKTHIALYRLQQDLEQRVRERTAEIQQLHQAAERFVPQRFLSYLDKGNIADVALGDVVLKEMTVMFSDIRNFTSLSEKRTPQETFALLDAFLQCISPVIRKHGGFIDKYLGDGIMALFSNEAEHAVRAAIEMHLELDKFNAALAKRGEEPLSIGVGLNTGHLMLGILGEPARLQGTVVSDAVNIASRLEGLTKMYDSGILISEHSLRHMSPTDIPHRFVDHVRVKGKETMLSVYEILVGSPDQKQKQQTKSVFEAALEHYYQYAFEKAAEKFREVLQKHPTDKTAAIYLERCQKYAVQGVPNDWTGVETLTTK